MGRPVAGAVALWIPLLALGCTAQRTRLGGLTTKPVATTAQASQPADDADFLDALSAKPLPTFDDGLRAILILADGQCKQPSFEARLGQCRARGFVPDRWKIGPTQRLNRGTLAYMICKVCRIKGGINWFLFGNRRYALREAIYRKLMDEGAAYQYLNGGELVAVLNKADQYMADHNLYPTKPVQIEPILGQASPAGPPVP